MRDPDAEVCDAQCCGIVMVVIGPLHMNILHTAMESACQSSVKAITCIGARDSAVVRAARAAPCVLCHKPPARTNLNLIKNINPFHKP